MSKNRRRTRTGRQRIKLPEGYCSWYEIVLLAMFLCSVACHDCHCCVGPDHMRNSHLYRLLLPPSVGKLFFLSQIGLYWKTNGFSCLSADSLNVHILVDAATSEIRRRSWRCQTAALQTYIGLTVGVLETTINQLTTTYSRVVYQSPLDHIIISGSSSNSCWCRTITSSLNLWQRAAILLEPVEMNWQTYRNAELFLFVSNVVYVSITKQLYAVKIKHDYCRPIIDIFL